MTPPQDDYFSHRSKRTNFFAKREASRRARIVYQTTPSSIMKIIAGSIAVLLLLAASQASIIVNPWVPIFKGIDHATGQMIPDAVDPRHQAVNALRIDLSDPDVQMFTDPPCTNCSPPYETIGYSTSSFLRVYGVQVAVNANFYVNCCIYNDGVPIDVTGLSISKGRVVSQQEAAIDSSNVMFTTNKQVIMIATNWPPTMTNGIYTAVSGHYALVTNGVNIGYSYLGLPDTIHQVQPRTAVGVSQDGRYFYLITIDGRQDPYSIGALDPETADWLIRFGSYNGINLDGGGSTTMVMADCHGNPIELNKPSDLLVYGRERVLGNHLGVFAKPLPGFISDVSVAPSDTYATITWTTASNATSQVQYGPDASYGTNTVLDPAPRTNHSATITGLTPGTTNYFQVISTTDTAPYTDSCYFVTTNFVTMLFDVTKSWKWTTNNLDGINWQARGYNDSNWFGPGPGLLYVENSAAVSPRNTPLPPNNGVQTQGVAVYPTYYFRTHFAFTNSTAAVSLIFTSFIDDGAVFYLNGVEIQRVRMAPPPAVITYTSTTFNNVFPCTGDATCPDIFTISGDLVTNLMRGDNVLAAEVHQYIPSSMDITFGSALGYARPSAGPPPPKLTIVLSGGNAIISWTGGGVTLQQSGVPAGSWADITGSVTNSPYLVTPLPGAARFYRLRN
jgi:hypothetical protein